MIPNTFEGVSFTSKMLPDTEFSLAYFLKQKLRDHSTFHHVFAYGNREDPLSVYALNDDSAMHRGITLDALEQRGIEDRLFVFEMKNRSIEDFFIRFNYTAVPKLLSSFMVQSSYRVEMDEWSVIP